MRESAPYGPELLGSVFPVCRRVDRCRACRQKVRELAAGCWVTGYGIATCPAGGLHRV